MSSKCVGTASGAAPRVVSFFRKFRRNAELAAKDVVVEEERIIPLPTRLAGQSLDDVPIPWVEKYRPASLDTVCGHDNVRRALKEMVRQRKFPHLLLFGPPGTGKTTIAISMVKEVHPGVSSSAACLHLNASDERGLETIRTRIRDFVDANLYIRVTPKFVILDEAENMTEQAQMSLRTFLDAGIATPARHVCFIFLANHLTKIHPDLLSRFVRFRLSFLPREIMIPRLQMIATAEGHSISREQIEMNLTLYRSDMRHQIQHLQQMCAHPTEAKTIERFMAFVRRSTLPALQNQVSIYLEQYEVNSFLTCLLLNAIKDKIDVVPYVRAVEEFRNHNLHLGRDAVVGWIARIVADTLGTTARDAM